MAITIVELARKVADDFIESIKDGNFETFQEMCDCYWWTSRDIRGEVEYMVNKQYGNGEWWLDDDGDFTNQSTGEIMAYRKFMRIVRNYIRQWEQENKREDDFDDELLDL